MQTLSPCASGTTGVININIASNTSTGAHAVSAMVRAQFCQLFFLVVCRCSCCFSANFWIFNLQRIKLASSGTKPNVKGKAEFNVLPVHGQYLDTNRSNR